MTSNDFRADFQKLTASQLPAAASTGDIAASLIRRDQRRNVTLAAISLVLWVLGTAGMLLLIVGLNRLVIFIRVADAAEGPPAATVSDHPDSGGGLTGASVSKRDETMLEGTSLIHHSLPLIGGSIIALLLAAMFTVLLIFTSRRATLTRIDLSLAQIAEQLLALQNASSSTGADAVGPADK